MALKNTNPAVACGARQDIASASWNASSCTNSQTSRPSQDRPVYVIRVRPEPGVDATRALRHFLKRALRSYGLRCVAPLDVEGAP